MRQAVPPTEDPVGRMARPVPGGVGPGRLRDLRVELEDGPGASPVLPVAARVRTELVPREEEGESDLGDLDAPELDPAGGLPLARGRPAIAHGRRPTARPRVEHVPDER